MTAVLLPVAILAASLTLCAVVVRRDCRQPAPPGEVQPVVPSFQVRRVVSGYVATRGNLIARCPLCGEPLVVVERDGRYSVGCEECNETRGDTNG